MSAETRRLFFLGAGASVADGVPLTSKLILGVAASLADPAHHSVKGPFRGIPELLERLYGVSRRDLKAASGFWPKGGSGTPPPLPTITEVLSLIDCLLAEDGVAGSYPRRGELARRPLHARELDRLRTRIVRAFTVAMSRLATKTGPGSTCEALAAKLTAQDTVVTTNWDGLLDRALAMRKGCPTPSDLGTDATVVDLMGKPVSSPGLEHPLFLKLHGSLTWLYCPRCTRLWVNPRVTIAALSRAGVDEGLSKGDASRCEDDCKTELRELLITPTYLKQYRNRHLQNIWARAHRALVASDRWIFAGYSLPADDYPLHALLLKALIAREENGFGPPRVEVVLPPGEWDDQAVARFQVLLRRAKEVVPVRKGFEQYVQSLT